MAWLCALVPYDGVNQPEYPGLLLDCDTRLQQGPLLPRQWYGPLFSAAPDVAAPSEVHGYAG